MDLRFECVLMRWAYSAREARRLGKLFGINSSETASSAHCAGEVRRLGKLGKLLGKILERWQAQHLGKCEGERMPQRGKPRRRGLGLRRILHVRVRTFRGGASHQVTEQEESDGCLCVLVVTASRLKTATWWVSSEHGDGKKKKTRQCNWWCAACGGQHDWRVPNRVSVIQDSGLAGYKSAQNDGRTQGVYCSRHLCGSKDWGSAERNEVREGGKAKIDDRVPGSCYSGRRE